MRFACDRNLAVLKLEDGEFLERVDFIVTLYRAARMRLWRNQRKEKRKKHLSLSRLRAKDN